MPDIPLAQLKGCQVTRLGNRHKAEAMAKKQDPWGRNIYWYGTLGSELDAGEGTDFHAIANGFASVTPLTVDMTAHDSLQNISTWMEEIKL